MIKVGNKFIGKGQPVFIVAEAGVNHNGNMSLAKKLVDVAVQSGVDAIKFQTFKAKSVVSKAAPKAEYQFETTDAGESQFDMLQKLELAKEQHIELVKYCDARGIQFISTPFDFESVDLLDFLNVPLFKIPSGEITNFPFLEYVAQKGKPIIMSTGMSFLGEVEEAVNAILATGNGNLAILHCVSNYPARIEDANLRAIKTLETAFNLPTGYSDHTLGIEVALAAVALGACIIEKHFTLDKKLPGPDHKASLEPHELKSMILGIRNVEKALGDGVKRPVENEKNTREVARRSLVAGCDIPAGTTITEEMIAIKRPGTGLKPGFMNFIPGRKALVDIKQDELISWEKIG